MSRLLNGLLTALATPFNRDDAIDTAALRRLVDRSVEAGVDALVSCGGTGEVATLTERERTEVTEVVVDQAAGRVPVVANTGLLTTAATIRLSKAAQAAGADVLMMITPYYEPLTDAEIDRFVQEAAEAVEVPIMLYNNPSVTGINLGVDRLADFGRTIENVAYVKDSSGNWEQALRLIHYHQDDIKLIVGWDSFLLSALIEGAAGVMAGAANVVPHELAAVVRAVRAGDLRAARGEWSRVYPVVDALLALPFPQAVKAGLRMQEEPVGAPRRPLLEIAESDLLPLQRALTQLNGGRRRAPSARPLEHLGDKTEQ